MTFNTGKKSWVVTFRTLLERKIEVGDFDRVRKYKAELAEVLENAYYLYDFQSVSHFQQEIESILSEITLPGCLTSSHDPIQLPGKRQPSFLESVYATLERYEVMERTDKAFNGFVDALILGGSMAYGPFFNVRGGIEGGSDLDIIATYDHAAFFNEKKWQNFINNELFEASDKKNFFQRLRIYEKLLRKGEANIFSHRFKVADKNIVVSVHFMDKVYFSEVMYLDFYKTMRKSQSNIVIAKDFKATYASGREGPLISLDGQKKNVKTEVHNDNGFIVETPLYMVNDDRLYLGLYYRITLPAFKVFGGRSSDANALMNMIQKTIAWRIKDERRVHGEASFTLAHPRGPIFPAGKYDDLA